jgi:predicted lipoprotein with Yx(FWY)xxD motif
MTMQGDQAGSVTTQGEPRPARAVTGWPRLALRVTGAGLLAAAGAIHLDLYLTGYRNIPTIGWLFLLQVIAAFALALAVLITGSRLAAAAGAGFALATLGGYLLSLWFGLFGFKEVRTTAGIVAGVIEVAAAAALGVLALTPSPASAGRHKTRAGGIGGLVQDGVRGAGWLVAGVSVVALVVLGGSVAAAGGSSPVSAGGGLKTASISGVTVLTNAKGFTLYRFAPDTPTKSVCNGSCAAYWPPVKGPVTLSAGVAGKVGTIKRSDGSLQATYNGHPLYTYVADGAPGQAHGNNLNLNGGFWYEVKVSG